MRYGRLFRDAGAAARAVARALGLSVFSRAALVVVALGVLVSLGVLPSVAHASSQTDALASCNAQRSVYGTANACFDTYGVDINYGGGHAYTFCVGDPPVSAAPYGQPSKTYCPGSYGGRFSFEPDAPNSNPCANVKPFVGQFGGKYTSGMTWCMPHVDTGNGSTTSCTMTFTPMGRPISNQWGNWNTYGKLEPSGNTCDGQGQEVKKPDGNLADPQPPDPGTNPPKDTPGQTCGQGSCYDPFNDKYCADVGGSKVCVPGDKARSGSGACASGGDGTLCAGSPAAPKPDATKVPDPPSQINSSDKYTQADPATGANQTVNTTTYNSTPGAAPSSGQGSGDTGPTKPTSPGTGDGDEDGDKTSASGGGDCNSPPVCTGNNAVCAVVQQQWQTRCGPDKSDKDGDGQPDWTQVGEGDGDKYNVSDTPKGDVIKADDGSGVLGKVDSSSWAGNSCPAIPTPSVMGHPFVTDQDFFCQWLAVIKGIVIMCAGITCAFMISRSNG